jgi:hypothetical protein
MGVFLFFCFARSLFAGGFCFVAQLGKACPDHFFFQIDGVRVEGLRHTHTEEEMRGCGVRRRKHDIQQPHGTTDENIIQQHIISYHIISYHIIYIRHTYNLCRFVAFNHNIARGAFSHL